MQIEMLLQEIPPATLTTREWAIRQMKSKMNFDIVTATARVMAKWSPAIAKNVNANGPLVLFSKMINSQVPFGMRRIIRSTERRMVL